MLFHNQKKYNNKMTKLSIKCLIIKIDLLVYTNKIEQTYLEHQIKKKKNVKYWNMIIIKKIVNYYFFQINKFIIFNYKKIFSVINC